MPEEDARTIISAEALDPVGLGVLTHRLPEPALEGLAREVIARMGRGPASPRAAEVGTTPPPALVALCKALVAPDPGVARGVVAALSAEGCGLDHIYLNRLAPAARLLGEWWDTDRASFAEVTIGISRIYGIMQSLRDTLPLGFPARPRRAAFASVPGEDHTLGVTMAADLFRREGWDIVLKIGLEHDALVESLADSGMPIIGLSASGAHAMPALSRLILALRSANPKCHIMLSGHVAALEPDLLSGLGVDALAGDVPTARAEMDRLWAKATQSGRDTAAPEA